MCQENKEIKFCTCGTIEKPDWKLTRSGKFYDFPSFVMGRISINPDADIIQKKRSDIFNKLKENTLLDIPDYAPQEEDVLEVFNIAIFRYKNGRWNLSSTYQPFGNKVGVRDGKEVIKGIIEQ